MSLVALLSAAGCGPEPEATEGVSDGSVDNGSGEGGLGPAQEEGEPCEPVLGCATDLFCDEGACAACGTDTPAPGKLCFGPPTWVAERSGRLEIAHLPTQDAVFVDNREVHVRLLLRDGAGSLREQWFGMAAERTEGMLLDLDGDGFDEFAYCYAYASHSCRVLSFEVEMDAWVPFASVPATDSEIDGISPHGGFPGRIFSADPSHDRWSSWLLYPGGAVRGAPLPVYPTDAMRSGDFDADGVPDLAAPVGDSLVVLGLDAAGVGYDVVATVAIPLDTTLVAVADLDGDGRDEVLLGTPAADLLIARRATSGGLTLSPPIPLVEQPDRIAIGDLDGDGRLDLALPDATVPPAEDEPPAFDRVLVLAQTEPGLFERLFVRAPGPLRSLAIFDVDRDGHEDLLVGGPEGIHQLLANP